MNIFFSKKNKRHIQRQLREKLRFNYILIIILTLLLGLFIFSLVNLFMVISLRREWKSSQTGTNSNVEKPAIKYYEETINKVVAPDTVNVKTSSSSVPSSPDSPPVISPNESRSHWRYNVFGDGFSNSYYVDMNKTNFRYDDMATAFYFSPLYEKRDNGACSQVACGFAEAPKTQFCLAKDSGLCLVWDGDKLRYNDKEVKAFTSLFYGCGGKPDRVSIYPLANYWLIGAIWSESGQEIGRAWRFDGKDLTPLDPENRVPFVTRQGYGGSNIYFGGDDDNFIVLYAGYDFSGYQIVDDKLWNITEFFNTRLAEGGFAPQIIKHKQGEETVWYICSLTENKPKLIKMWQNGSKIIRGLLSLGEEFFAGGYDSAICREGSDGHLEIATAKKNGGTAGYHRWTLVDKGFDQSRAYQAVSVNLSKSEGTLKMANFSGLSVCADNYCGTDALKNNLDFSISNNGADWQTTIIGQENLFSTSGSDLLWKLQASPNLNKSYYSPWFGAINSVYYAWVE